MRKLNRDAVMKVWRSGNCENFVSTREGLVVDAFLSQWRECRMGGYGRT